MTIVAKYPATCAACCGKIIPGQKIEWSKGAPVRHTGVCGAASATVVAPVENRPARTSRGTWTGCRCGSVEEYSRDSDCRSCRHDAE